MPDFLYRLRYSPFASSLERLWALTLHRDSDESSSSSYRAEAGGFVNLHLMEHSPRTPFRGRLLINGAKRNGRESTAHPVAIVFTATNRVLEPQSRGYSDGIDVKLDDRQFWLEFTIRVCHAQLVSLYPLLMQSSLQWFVVYQRGRKSRLCAGRRADEKGRTGVHHNVVCIHTNVSLQFFEQSQFHFLPATAFHCDFKARTDVISLFGGGEEAKPASRCY